MFAIMVLRLEGTLSTTNDLVVDFLLFSDHFCCKTSVSNQLVLTIWL